jgi:uncharacterized protein YaeQ
MALKSTIFKADLQISDLGRNYYHDHSLTIARHPSETDERLMVRLLAFALHADEALVFANGMGTDDEPALWQKDLTGAIKLWIDVGQPDEKRVRRACGRAEQVVIYSYGGHGADVWRDQMSGSLDRVRNLTVVSLPGPATRALAALAQRSMRFQITIQDGQVWMGDGKDTVHFELPAAMVPRD